MEPSQEVTTETPKRDHVRIFKMIYIHKRECLEQFEDVISWQSDKVEQIEANAQVDIVVTYEKAIVEFEDIKKWRATVYIEPPKPQFRDATTPTSKIYEDTIATYSVYHYRMTMK